MNTAPKPIVLAKTLDGHSAAIINFSEESPFNRIGRLVAEREYVGGNVAPIPNGRCPSLTQT